MDMTRNQIIEVFIVRASSTDREELRRTLEKITTEQLEEAYKTIQLEATEEEYLRIGAERAAERALHELHTRRVREPQRKAEAERQEKQDRETFKQAARTLQSFGETEANLNVITSTLGLNFTAYSIQQALASNALSLSPPSQEELAEWTRQEIETH